MLLKMNYLIFLGLLVALEAKKKVVPPSHPYVMTIELMFKEENITNFITESFFATKDNNLDEGRNCNVNLYDILRTLPLATQSSDSIISAVELLKVTLEDDDVNRFLQGLNYTELAEAGFSLRRIYKDLVTTYFQNATQSLLACLNILEIAAEFTTVYAFGTDEELFPVLQKGNFSLRNIQEIAAIINAPLNIQELSRILGFKKYDGAYFETLVNNNFTVLLEERGLEKENFEQFLGSFGLTVSDFKKISSFKKFLKTCTEAMSLGVAMAPNEVITNDGSVIGKLMDLGDYVSLNVKSLQNSNMKYVVSADQVMSNDDDTFVVRIEQGLPNYINRTKNYQGILLKNCTYVTYDATKHLVDQNVTVRMVDAKLTIPKLLSTSYRKGSPLVCESILYGLAADNSTDSIVFTMVGDYANVAKIDSQMVSGLYNLLTSLFNFLDVCNYRDCDNVDISTNTSEVAIDI